MSSRHIFLGSEIIVRLLLNRGANVNALDNANQSAILYAAENGNLFPNKFNQILSMFLKFKET